MPTIYGYSSHASSCQSRSYQVFRWMFQCSTLLDYKTWWFYDRYVSSDRSRWMLLFFISIFCIKWTVTLVFKHISPPPQESCYNVICTTHSCYISFCWWHFNIFWLHLKFSQHHIHQICTAAHYRQQSWLIHMRTTTVVLIRGLLGTRKIDLQSWRQRAAVRSNQPIVVHSHLVFIWQFLCISSCNVDSPVNFACLNIHTRIIQHDILMMTVQV